MINPKLAKIRLAAKTAKTKNAKKRALENAQNYSDTVDDRIKSIAVNKFVIRKAQKLKQLGKLKEDINEIVIKLQVEHESIVSKSIKWVKGFGIDKKFVNMSTEEILEKVSAIPQKQVNPSVEVPVPENDEQKTPEKIVNNHFHNETIVEQDKEPNKNSETETQKPKTNNTTINNSKNGTSEVDKSNSNTNTTTNNSKNEVTTNNSTINNSNAELTEINNSEVKNLNSKNEVTTNNSTINNSNAELTEINNSEVNNLNSKNEVTISGSTVSLSGTQNVTIEGNNSYVYGNGYNKNTKNGSESGLDLKINPDTVNTSEIERNNELIYDYLVSNGELDIADYVLDLMSEPKVDEVKKTSEINPNLYNDEIKHLSYINSGIYEELKKLQEQQIDEQDTSISIPQKVQEHIDYKMGSSEEQVGGEKEKSGFFSTLATMALGGSVAYFAGLFDDENFKKSIEFIKDGDFSGLIEHLGGMDWLNGVIKTAAIALIVKFIGPIKSSIKLIKSTIKTMGTSMEFLKKMFSVIPKLVKSSPKVLSNVVSNANKVFSGKSTKPVSKVVNDSALEASRSDTKVDKVDKVSKDTTKVKKASKLSSSSIGKKMLKFTKFVPFLGAAIASGSALYAAKKGYENAGEVLGEKPENIKEVHKVAAAVGSAIEDFLWPFNPDAKTTAGLIISAASSMGIDVSPKEEVQKDGILKGLVPNKSKVSNFGGYEFERKNYVINNVASFGSKSMPEKTSNPDDYQINELFNLHNTKVEDVKRLNSDVLHNFKALGAEYYEMFGEKIQINSAFRSIEEQAELKRKYGSKAASPGSSMHNYGFAVDIQSSQANKAVKSGLFDKYGFWRPVMPSETWHVEPKGIDRESIRIAGKKRYNAKLDKSSPSVVKVEQTPNVDESPEKVSNNFNAELTEVNNINPTNELTTNNSNIEQYTFDNESPDKVSNNYNFDSSTINNDYTFDNSKTENNYMSKYDNSVYKDLKKEYVEIQRTKNEYLEKHGDLAEYNKTYSDVEEQLSIFDETVEEKIDELTVIKNNYIQRFGITRGNDIFNEKYENEVNTLIEKTEYRGYLPTDLSGKTTSEKIDILNEVELIKTDIKKELETKIGKEKGDTIYKERYEKSTNSEKPEVIKNKKIQNIENTEKRMIQSTQSFERIKTQSLNNAISNVSINSSKTQTRAKESVNILNGFSDY